MKKNRIPAKERIKQRIMLLENRIEATHVPIGDGNPYYRCSECGISDPQLSVQGKHWKNCPIKGIDKQILYYKFLLEELEEVS